ncbi:hypothetical protein [Streptomyces sp. NPDC088789]|uniref:hypothetical protein n=1 Tax=Streptomyces sp. NPDC088789 TaxID=3365899 RepID=UPI00381D5083
MIIYQCESPFASVPEAEAWLGREAPGLATVRLDDLADLPAVDLPTAQAAERLTEILLTAHARTRAAAVALREALAPHALPGIDVLGRLRVRLRLRDSAELDTAQLLACLLEAPGLDDDLKLERTDDLHRMAERLSWLLTGVTGARVAAQAVRESPHQADEIAVTLSCLQATALAGRLTAGAAS